MDEVQNQTPVAGTPIYQESQEKNAKWLWLLIILIIIGALVFAYLKGLGPFARFKSNVVVESPSPISFSSPSPFVSPQASSSSSLDRGAVKIRVLNGSGTAGVGSSAKDFLDSKGYKVVSVGNADTFDFTQTVLKFKKAFLNYQQILTADLSSKYSVTSSPSNLEATDSADIEVTVGSK